MNKFVLLSLKRSGSTYLVSALNSQADITCAGEIFKEINPLRIIHPEYSYTYTRNKDLKNKVLHHFRNSKLVNEHLEKIYKENENNLFGFKLMPRQIKRLPETKKYLIENKIPIIVLTRENHIERLVSIKVAAKTKVFGSKTAHKKIEKIFLEPSTLINEIDKMAAQCQEMKDIAKQTKHLFITYEDLTIYNIEKTQNEIFEFLKVTPNKLESSLKKLIKKPLSEIIENYDDVSNLLQQSKYKYLLEK